MDRIQELDVLASDETLHTVLDAIEACLIRNKCPDDIRMMILICAEEIYVNIAHYAYGGRPGRAVVRIEAAQDTKICRITFKDGGIPYNPLEKEDPDITLSAEEREVGGLGIYMVKQSMDRVEYEYKDGLNILTIEKKIG